MDNVNGILLDTMWCTGCHACEVACQMLKGLPVGQFGIKLAQIGPYKYGDGKWQFFNVPSLTEQCDLCVDRTAAGKFPSCVKHCQSQCLTYGPIDQLVKDMVDKPYSALLTANR